MKLLQMSGCDVACSLAPTQADHTHCSSSQNGGCNNDDKHLAKRDLNQFTEKEKNRKYSLGTVHNCMCERISVGSTHQ